MADFNRNSGTNTPMPQKSGTIKSKIRKYFYITLAVLFVIFGLFIYWSYFFTYSDGARSGLLQKFSRKGAIFKTYEGEMILSSVQSNNNIALASEKFLFSVADKDIAQQLEALQGKNVVVYYKEKNRPLPWRGESTYIVSSVKVSE